MSKLIIAALLWFLAQTLVWFQSYAPLKIAWFMKTNWLISNGEWLAYIMAIPVTYVFINAVRISYEVMGGAWGSRFLGFSMGVISFAILTYVFFGEGMNLKTLVCLLLAVAIISIQIFWKTGSQN